MNYLCAPMRIHLLLITLTLSVSGMAQFNTIAPAGSRLSTTQISCESRLSQSDSVIKQNDNVREVTPSQGFPKLTIHPPLKGDILISSRYGNRNNPFGKKATEHHGGIDLRAKAGTPIYAMMPGTVEAIGYDSRSGNVIKLRHGNFTISYCHLIKKPAFAIGTQVPAGMPVAYVGSTGRSTGPHLHITLKLKGKIIDPTLFLNMLKSS